MRIRPNTLKLRNYDGLSPVILQDCNTCSLLNSAATLELTSGPNNGNYNSTWQFDISSGRTYIQFSVGVNSYYASCISLGTLKGIVSLNLNSIFGSPSYLSYSIVCGPPSIIKFNTPDSFGGAIELTT